jgi:uncharacterized protein involved in response to NO
MSATPPIPFGLAPRRSAPASGPSGPDPYRVLFPLGVLFALAGVAPWLFALRGGPWPAALHMTLMIEGFEQSFVAGFLLTAMPGFTRGPRCRPWEWAAVLALLVAFAAFALAGRAWAAHLAFAATIVLLAAALVRRMAAARHLPPEEFVFVALGLLLGLAGAGLLVAQDGFGVRAPAWRLGERLVSLGLTLSLVLGVGGLLVPAFTGMRDPLVIPGLAGPHQRAGRRPLYLVTAAALAGAFALEAAGHPGLGALLRALAASALLLLVWKLWRAPGIRGPVPRALRLAGWLVLAGLWLAALWPAQATTAYHLVFIGGYGLLTLAIATRVTVAHGRHPPGDEARLLSPWVLAALGLALLARLAAAPWPAGALHAYAAAAALWMAAWLLWGARALPRMARPGAPRRL